MVVPCPLPDFYSSPSSPTNMSGPSVTQSTQSPAIAILQTATAPTPVIPRPHRQIHRNRASYSCHSCRRRKVKCDRQHPTCGNCCKMGENCVYSDNTGKGAAARIVAGEREKASNGGISKPRTHKNSSSIDLSQLPHTQLLQHHSQQQHQMSMSPRRCSMGDINLEERRGSLGGVKRQRTDKYPVQEEHSRFRSHSRSSSSNDVHSGSERSNTSTPPSPFQPEHSIQPLPASLLTSVISGGELETKVNRLTEIVDQWYRHAYARGGQGPQGQTPTVKPTPELAPEIWAAMAGLQAETNQESHHNASNDNDNMQRQKPQPEMPPEQKYRPQSKERDTVPSFCAQPESRPATAVSSTHFASGAGDVDEVALGHLSIQENGRSRYVGSSFWALLSSESTELNQFLKSSNKTSSQNHDISGLSTPPQDEGSYASPISSQSPVPSRSGISSGENLVSLLQLLPSKSLCHKLYASFLTGVHPVMPLIHAPTFDRQYQSFWEWFPDNTHTLPGSDIVDNPTFLPLLFAVLYSGTMSMAPKTVKENFEGRSKEQITAHLHAAATDALTAAQFPRAPTLNSLITFLIIQTCMIREEEPLTSFSFIGTAMRVAQQMGLHRDGSLFGLGEIECEVRRRVWWHIMHLDIQGAIATGLPPLGGSGEDQFDTRMVSELRDECIGSAVFPDTPVCSARGSPAAEGAPYCEYPKTKTSPAMILAVGRYETAILIRKIITRLLGIKPPHKTDIVELGEKIYNLKTNIERKIARIPARGLPEMGFIPGGENVEEEREGVFNSWARIMLSMLSDRAYGVLYQPFLKSAKNKLWMHARHCALRSSHSFLRKFIHLSRSTAFKPYHWYCPGTSQPLHATMILLLDLYERPQSPEASRSRIFVDEVFALFGEHGNYATEDGEICPRPLKDGGCEAWALLARLRRRGVSRARLGEVNGIPNDLDEWSQQQQQQQQARVATSTNTPYFTPLNDDMGASHLDPDGLQELSRLVGVDVDLQCATDGAGMMELDLTREDIDWKEWDQIFGRFVDMAEEGSAAAAAAAAAAARTGLTDVSRGGLAQLQWGIGGIEDS